MNGELVTLQSRAAEFKASADAAYAVGADLYYPSYTGGLLAGVTKADSDSIVRTNGNVDIDFYEGTLTLKGATPVSVDEGATVYVYNAILGTLTTGTTADLPEYGTVWAVKTPAGLAKNIYVIPAVKPAD